MQEQLVIEVKPDWVKVIEEKLGITCYPKEVEVYGGTAINWYYEKTQAITLNTRMLRLTDKYCFELVSTHPLFSALKKKVDGSLARTYDGAKGDRTRKEIESMGILYMSHVEYNAKSKLSKDITALQLQICRDLDFPLETGRTFRGVHIDFEKVLLVIPNEYFAHALTEKLS